MRRENGSVVDLPLWGESKAKGEGQIIFQYYHCPDCGKSERHVHDEGFAFFCGCGMVLSHEHAGPLLKKCAKCGRELTLDHFCKCDGSRSDGHPTTRTGLSGMCFDCKDDWNDVANGFRKREQHISAREVRALVGYVMKDIRSDTTGILARFGYKCWCCGAPLTDATVFWDHTCPLSYGWPMSVHATPLCKRCNDAKSAEWPSAFYPAERLEELASLTGIPFTVLAGPRHVNPEFVSRLQAQYTELKALRPVPLAKFRVRILNTEGIDIAGDNI